MEAHASRTLRIASVVLTLLLWLSVVAGASVVAHRFFGLLQDSSVLTISVTANVPPGVSGEDLGLPPAFGEAGSIRANVDLQQPNVTQRLLATLPAITWWALGFAAVWLVRRVVRSAAHGDPFRASNVLRLRWLGAIFLLGYPVAAVVDAVATRGLFSPGVWTTGPLPADGISAPFHLVSWPALLAGVSLLALAEVFAYGIRLREDVDATI
jgi:Protein of unknown function (DUF2975)